MMGTQVSMERLREAIEASWARETSSDPQSWDRDNPALGQCAVMALIVQDFLGGALLRTLVGDVSHYWNVLPDGEELDLTRHQFEHYRPHGREHRERSYVLSFPETRRRYVRLLALVTERLEERRAGGGLASPVQLEHP